MTMTSEPIQLPPLRDGNMVICEQGTDHFIYVFNSVNEVNEAIAGKDYYGIYLYPEVLTRLGLVMRPEGNQWEGHGVVFTLHTEDTWTLFFQKAEHGPNNYKSKQGPFLLHDFQNLYVDCMGSVFPVNKHQLTDKA